MASCCPAGSWPALQAPEGYKAEGTETKLEDLPLYTVGDPASGKAVIVLPELFGWAGRLKGICDTLAAEGYYVIMPDCHRGDYAKIGAEGFDFGAYLAAHTWEGEVKSDFEKMMTHLDSKGCKSVGAIGFCWGVWALCKANSCGFPLKCGAGPHPSTKLEGMWGGNELEMFEKVTMPVLMMPAGNDPDFVKPGGEGMNVLEKKGGSCVPFPDMSHGWCSRGDLSDEKVKRDVEGAMTKAIAHFKTHL
mmetsp:Transcript_16412/g.42396  ORF Transcript_16412/g.42396 Transcript_16412/m.42396 type:complete len:247 (-) Transcript_16412:190-930(-)